MRAKQFTAALLCAVLTVSTLGSGVTYAAKETNSKITVDMEDFSLNKENGIYDLTQKIHNLKGTYTGAVSELKKLRYELTDEAGTIVKAGYVKVKKNGSWKISKMGFLLGQNTLTLTATTTTGTTQEVYTIYNEEMKNTANVKVDEKDNDGDGLINYWEDYFGTKKNKADTDGDGISDYEEIMILGSDALEKDSDGNGVLDGEEDFDGDGDTNAEELAMGTNPLSADSDEDGLSDKEERNIYKTDPLVADTDQDGAKDGWEVENGFDPLSKEDSFTVTLTEGKATLIFTAQGSVASTLTLKKAQGYGLSDAYEIQGDGSFQGELTITGSQGALAKYDAQTQTYGMLEGTAVTESGIYLYVKETDSEEEEESSSSKDSNKDGITDADTFAMCEGTLTTSLGEKVFGDATYKEVQANKDFDGDGLSNGEEVTVKTGEDGSRYVYVNSSPVLADTDEDGIEDAKDSAPLERGLKDGVVGSLQIYSRHNDEESFMTGHAWLVFTSYVDNESFVLDEINRSYRYDKEQATYVEADASGIYTLDRGEYVSIGNYRSVMLDAVYDSLGSDAAGFVADMGIEDQFDLDNLTFTDVLKYAATAQGASHLYSTIFGGSGVSIRYNEEIYDTYAYDPDYELPNAVLTKEVTQEQLEEIMAYDNAHNYYHLLSNNCSTIASTAWNLAFSDTLTARAEGIYALMDTPLVLKASILAREDAQENVRAWGVSVE